MTQVRSPARRTATLAALGATALALLGCTPEAPRQEALERFAIAIPMQVATTNVLVAQHRGLFAKHGLAVTLQPHVLGREAIRAAIEGEADLALAADTPFLLQVMNGAAATLVATAFSSGHYNVVVARRDRGIEAPADLAGKTVGLPFGTSMDFFSDALLAVHRVPRRGVRLLDLEPDDAGQALLEGRVDAVATFPHRSLRLARALGQNGVTFADPALFSMTFNLVGDSARLKSRAAAVRKLLAALAEASDWVKANPGEAQAIVARILAANPEEVAQIWNDSDFSVSLSQSLLISLEDQSRWAIRYGLVRATKVPNYLYFIDTETLAAVRRSAVTMIR